MTPSLLPPMSMTTLSRCTATTVPLDDLALFAEVAALDALLEERREATFSSGMNVGH